MTKEQIVNQIKKKKSFLCIGLDSDLSKLPEHLLKNEDPQFDFNKQIIDATATYTVAYKPNLAFYEALGSRGWLSLEKTAQYLKSKYPEIFIIADAKRGDIGNTSSLYAKAFFESLPFDALTVAPYMGEDSVKPFLAYPQKWVILLALTSNQGAFDFQFFQDKNKRNLFERVLEKSKDWADENQMMYVVGATKVEWFKQIRDIIPDYFILVPGVGAQGGSLEEVAKYGMNKHCGILVNSSRNIIFADSSVDFAFKASDAASSIQKDMERLLLHL